MRTATLCFMLVCSCCGRSLGENALPARVTAAETTARLPLFPELRRYPESMAEEKLQDSNAPPVAFLFPAQRRDVHLRACAILGARFGQLAHVTDLDFELGEISDWPSFEKRNVVIVGRWDELGNLPILTSIDEKVASLAPGKGMLAEFIVGERPNQHRWILATGSDDAGLDNALLVLGSAPALNSLPPSPAVVHAAPEIPARTETLSKPSPNRTTLKDLGWGSVHIGAEPEYRVGWRVPPGYIVEHGELTLNFRHPRQVTRGLLEVFVATSRLGRVVLTAENTLGSVKLPLPEKLPGHDAMMFTFRAWATNGTHAGEGLATILASSALDAVIEPATINGFADLDMLLLRDSFLRRVAFVLPPSASLQELYLLFDLCRNLGRQLPSAPILWPQACGFSEDSPASAECLSGRSAVVLAPVQDWRMAAPRSTRLLIEQIDAQTVRFQGRKWSIAQFEPTLALGQMIPAPWNDQEWLITVGGWRDVPVATVKQLILSGAAEGKLYGNMAALDAKGRWVAHDSRRPVNESFGHKLQTYAPAGVSAEDTASRLAVLDGQRQQSRYVNKLVFWIAGVFVALVTLGRLLLVWERTRRHKQSVEREVPSGGAP